MAYAGQCFSGLPKTVSLLLSRGSSAMEVDMSEQTPLHHACDWNYQEIVDLLLKRGAEVNATDDHGFTPFLVAVGWGREAILELLFGKKVNVLAMDDQQNNVFHICGATGRANIIQTILKRYADESSRLLVSKNLYGWTPLDFSVRCGHLETTKILVAEILKGHRVAKKETKTFVHTRFGIVSREDLEFKEQFLNRFVDEHSDMTSFRIPRCKWFIQSPGKEEYEQVRQFISRFDDKLKTLQAMT